jgi:hypothetical protein
MGLSSPVETTVMARSRLAASGPFQELAHLAAALADKGDDHGIEAAGAGQHGQERRLADAGAAKMPMRWPSQIGMNRSMTRTPVRSGFFTRARVIAEGGGASAGMARSPAPRGPSPSTALAQRVDHPPLPALVGIKGHGAETVGACADADVDGAVKRLHCRPRIVDTHHLTRMLPPAGAERDTVP